MAAVVPTRGTEGKGREIETVGECVREGEGEGDRERESEGGRGGKRARTGRERGGGEKGGGGWSLKGNEHAAVLP
jgi:hypothetical protein